MDNIIELIVFLFIIYSILAPLFGKKKPKKTTRQIPNDYSGDVKTQKTSPEVSTTDILEDFLGFKIPKTEDQFPIPQNSFPNDDLELSTKNYDRDLTTKYKNLEAESKSNEISYDRYKSLEIRKTQKTSNPISSFSEKSGDTVFISSIIRNKFTEKATLKDYILISEILNKPKALRR